MFHLPSAADIDGASSDNAVMESIPLFIRPEAFEKLGNKGWNWETLKKYYNRVEKFVPPEVKDDMMRFDVREHGHEGTPSPTRI